MCGTKRKKERKKLHHIIIRYYIPTSELDEEFQLRPDFNAPVPASK
jgi:hypothetical protein